MDSALKLLAVFALVAINGVFVAAEFALVGARPTRIDQLVAQGNRWARLVKRAMDDPNRFISAAQVGIIESNKPNPARLLFLHTDSRRNA